MKIQACCKKYDVEDEGMESPRIGIQIAAPTSNEFFEISGVLDTGCDDAIAIPLALIEELGIRLPALGRSISSTANGPAPMIESAADVRIACSSGRSITFQSIPISIDENLDEILVGMGLLRYFNIHFTDGEPKVFEFNDKAIQSS